MVRKRTRWEKFLADMEEVVAWSSLLNLLEPYYHKTGSQVGRPPYPLETMLRIDLMQNWYSLSDSAMEDALIEVYSIRCFARIDLCRDQIPDETTILAFQHILEKKNLAEKILETTKEHLSSQGHLEKSSKLHCGMTCCHEGTCSGKGLREPAGLFRSKEAIFRDALKV